MPGTLGPSIASPKSMAAFAVIEAPSILGLRPTGVETLPEALLRVGLAEQLGARHAGRVEPPPYDPHRDPETKLLNPRAIASPAILTELEGFRPLVEPSNVV